MPIPTDDPLFTRFRSPDVQVLGTPYVRSHAYGWCDYQSIVVGLREILANHRLTVTWIVADHDTRGSDVYEIFTIGVATIDDHLVFRFCGERGHPDGVSSHSLCDAEGKYGGIEVGAAALACRLARAAGCVEGRTGKSAWIYRQPAVDYTAPLARR